MTKDEAKKLIREFAQFKCIGLSLHCRKQMQKRSVTTDDLLFVMFWGAIMDCPNCNALMSHQKESYHYIESGLNNIYLEEMDIFKCECGEEIVTIPAIPELHTLIGINLIRKKYLLYGKEIRFLRKNLGFAAKKLAEIIGVDNATISRWENDNQSMSGPNDRLLRLVYMQIKGIPTDAIKIEENFPEILPEHAEMSDLVIPQGKWTKDKEACSL